MHKLKRNNKRAIQHFQIPPQLKNDTRRKKTNVGRYQREKKCTKLNEIIIKHSTFPNSTTAQNDTKPTKSIREKKRMKLKQGKYNAILENFCTLRNGLSGVVNDGIGIILDDPSEVIVIPNLYCFAHCQS